VILTMAWNYYVKTKQESLAVAFIKECAAPNKKVIAFNAGDFGIRIAYFKNLIVIRHSSYKSKFTNNEYSLPAFIADHLKNYFYSEKVFQRSYQPTPVIGFCGQTNPSHLNAIKEVFKTWLRNLNYYTWFSKE